jgi:hypothetical protein
MIDDSALGCPLTYNKIHPRPFVNWSEVEKILINTKIIKLTKIKNFFKVETY